MNILPMGGELLHADKQTERKAQTVDFYNLANTPKQNDTHDIQTVLLELNFNSAAVPV